MLTAEFLTDREALVYTSGSSLREGTSGPGYWVFTPARLAGLAAAREKLRAACPRATPRLQERAEARTLALDASAGPETSA